MTEQPNREVAVLNAALELRPEERPAYLDPVCAGDAALRQQVEALLQAHEQAENFLEAPPAGLDFKQTARGNIPLTEKPGDRIGRINDGVPVPKVIDFGIAKATVGRLTDQTLFTAFEQFIGTPAYMSPSRR